MPVLYRYWVDKGNTLKGIAPLYLLGNFSNQDLKDHALILDRVLALSVYTLCVIGRCPTKNPTAMENGGVKTKVEDLSSGRNCAPQKREQQPQKPSKTRAVPGVANKSPRLPP
jgi:hypothetical protein